MTRMIPDVTKNQEYYFAVIFFASLGASLALASMSS